MTPWKKIVQQAEDHSGGKKALQGRLPQNIKTTKSLAAIPDHRYLSEITKSIFKAGFVWRVIDNKWENFEKAFWQFDIETCRHMSPEDEDRLCTDESIVRNRQKILTVQRNATMIADIVLSHGSFGVFVAEWPNETPALSTSRPLQSQHGRRFNRRLTSGRMNPV